MALAHKSAISVNVLYIPVGLYKTTRDISVSFNQLCKDTHERVKYKKICPSCNKEVKSDDIIRGYEYEKDKYVIISDDELERIKTSKDKTLHVDHFAKMSEIDSLYYDKNYYLVPERGAEAAFEILRQGMLSLKEVAIAKTVIGTNEQLVVLYPTKDTIIAKTLFFQEEIQDIPVSPAKVQVEKSNLDLAKTMITAMTQKFDISAYHDEYQARLWEALEAKIKGNEIINVETGAPINIMDYMEAIKKNVEMANKKGLA